VLCDRFADSTRAYQGGRVRQDVLETVISLGSDGLVPDMTLLLDLPPEIGLERARNRLTGVEDTFERSNLAFHREVRQRFLALAHGNGSRFTIIDATRNESDVAEAVRAAVRERLVASQSGNSGSTGGV